MSYCGACGNFYFADCPRRPDGLCSPAPNPHEERIARLMAMSVACAAEIAGMVAENKHRENCGNSVAYGEEAFAIVSRQLNDAIGAAT